MLNRIKRVMDTHIDYTSAAAGALVLGGVVFWINHDHSTAGATTAAIKQATYTFFAAGVIAKNNERLARRLDSAALSLLLAVSVSSSIAIGLTYLVHSLKGTPEPLLSTVPTMLLGPPGFLALGWRARRLAPPVPVTTRQDHTPPG